MSDITHKEYREKFESYDNWLEYMIQPDHWDKTKCPMGTEVYTAKNDFYGNESYGDIDEIEGIEHAHSETITFDRTDTHYGTDVDPDGSEEPQVSTWDCDTTIFVYKDYLYTITSEYIHDFQTYTAWGITRKPLVNTW